VKALQKKTIKNQLGQTNPAKRARSNTKKNNFNSSSDEEENSTTTS
jgi:hypothetical protein